MRFSNASWGDSRYFCDLVFLWLFFVIGGFQFTLTQENALTSIPFPEFCGNPMIERTYRWVLSLAGRPNAERALAAVSFAESSFFPIPPDAVLIPMVLARKDKAWRLALICTISSVLGGIVGYAIGAFLFDTVGQWLIKIYGLEEKSIEFKHLYDHWGLWVILIKGLTPIPYKLVTIVSGIAHFNLAVFIAASVVTRGIRFFVVAALLRRYGQPIQDFIEKRLTLVAMIFLACIIGGYALLKYV
jgi:membrane protein YqaA with SNARE-associated domain